MTRDDKVKTLKLHLAGLYENEKEVENFLDRRPGLSFDSLKFYGLRKLHYQRSKHKNEQAVPVLKKAADLRTEFQNSRGRKNPDRPDAKYLLRVDDFPHWSAGLNDFRKFLDVLRAEEVPCLLGVTPCPSSNRHDPGNRNFRELTAEEIAVLANPLVEIALHGFTHQALQPEFHSEFIGLSGGETEEYIKKALAKLQAYGLKTNAFIAPFNTIDLRNYQALKKYFRIITGGPETVKYFGLKISPVYLSGTLYVPSYRPLCGGSEMVADFLERFKPNGILPLTLHWADERSKDFAGVKRLAGLIKGKTLKWQSLL